MPPSRCRPKDVTVLQVVKGFLGRSGASIFAGNLQLQKTRDPAEEERFMGIRARYGSSYLNDPDYIRRACRFTEKCSTRRWSSAGSISGATRTASS